MSDFKETQHGRNHRPGGSDPIPFFGPDVPGCLVQAFTVNNDIAASAYLYSPESTNCEFDLIAYDDASFFSLGTPDRFTIPSDGVYYVQGSAQIRVKSAEGPLSPATYSGGLFMFGNPGTIAIGGGNIVYPFLLTGTGSSYLDPEEIVNLYFSTSYVGKMSAGDYLNLVATSNYIGGITAVDSATFVIFRLGDQA